MKIRLLIAIISCVLLSPALEAQEKQEKVLSKRVLQPDRYELEKKDADDYFRVVSAEEAGVVIFRESDESNKNTWEVISLDTTFTERWKNVLEIDRKFVLKGYDISSTRLFLLFREGEFALNNYHLIKIDIDSGTITRYDIENEIELELTHLITVNDALILGGYVRSSPTIVAYILGEEKVKVVPGYFKDKSDIIDVRANTNGTFNVITSEKEYTGYVLRFRMYSSKGDVLFDKAIPMDDKYELLTGMSTDFVKGNIAIAGTYGVRNSYFSQGVFFAIVKPEGQKDEINYYNFSELEHSFDYMNPKRAERLRENFKKAEASGKEFRFSERVALHQVQGSINGGYLLEAEMYDPKYEHVQNPAYYSYYNYPELERYRYNREYTRPPTSMSNVNQNQANRYEYHLAMLIRLDGKGKLLWDNSVVIEEVETEILQQIVGYHEDGDRLNTLYKRDEEISYKIIEQDKENDLVTIPLALKHENDEIKYNYEGIGGAEHWYGNTWLTWGYQRLGNKVNEAVDKRRTVLYVNKVRFK